MYSETAELLENARKRTALSQEALAAALKVSQQSVSRWMKGQAAPRARSIEPLAEVLGVAASDIRAAIVADRNPIESIEAGSTAAPVRPLSATLPFMSLPADRFEQFLADLLARRYPAAQVSVLGGQGDDQQGFDVHVEHPENQTDNVQCKRESQFGPKKIAKAVSAAEWSANRRIIALARTATAAARFEIDKHDGWELWDQVDLSRMVRELPEESAQRLVKTYFPNHLEAFLGVPPSGPWMTVDEYYRHTAHTVLDHQGPLIGRGELLADISAWMTDHDDSPIGALIGRGGLGKSKLLHDLATGAEASVDVRFLAIGQTPTPSDFDLLPSGRPLLIVVDDAHNIDGVAALAAQLHQHRPAARLLLASRPYGEAALDVEVWRLGQAPSRARRWTLTDLTDTEARDLVANLIHRSAHHPITRQLAAISFDCPFIAVVAADLLSRNELSASAFASDVALRREIISHYGSQLSASGSGHDLARRRAVLNALAAYQPVKLNDPANIDAMTQLSRIEDWDEVNGRIRELEDQGLVLRRGDSIRVVPDMLGDVLLAQASYDERSGTATSFVDRAHRAASGSALQHLMVNASRMDWQLRDGVATGVDIVGQLWTTLKDELLGAAYGDQVLLLKLLARIAYYQPALALDLVRAVLDADEPDPAPASDRGQIWPSSTHRDVVEAVAPVLKAIGYDLRHLPDVLDLLWSLAQDDDRPTNQYPDHPMRVLVEMADLHNGKPFDYLFAIIQAAESWLREPAKLSPFDVLKPMLAVEVREQVGSRSGLSFYSYGISPESVRDVRSRVIDIAVAQAGSADPAAAVRGVEALEAAIRFPIGMFQRTPSVGEVADWAQEFVPTIVELGDIGADQTRDAAVRIAVRHALWWHAHHGPDVTRNAASQALGRVCRAFIDDLAQCLHDGWGRLDYREDGDYEKAEEAQQIEFGRVARELIEDRSAAEVLALLDSRIGIDRVAFDRTGNAARFVRHVFSAAPAVAIALLDSVERGVYPELTAFVSVALGVLAERGYGDAIECARRLCNSNLPTLKQSVADTLAWNRGTRQGLLPGELALLSGLARDDAASVRATVGRAVWAIAPSDRVSAVEVLSRIEFRGNRKVASEALSALIPRGPLTWTDIDLTLRQAVLDQLVECVKIDDYGITAALRDLSAAAPVAVTKMLMARIDRAASCDSIEYEPLPYHWDPPLRIAETESLSQCLAMIRDWLADNPTSSARRIRGDDGANLYSLVAGDWSEQAFSILDVSSATSEPQLMAVAQILSQVPVPLFLNHVDSVVKVLRQATRMDRQAREALLRTMLPTNGVSTGVWSGKRPDMDVAERDEAGRIASTLPRGSVERQFFERLALSLAVRADLWADRPEPADFDGREW